MLKLFFGQNKPVKINNNSKIYYYGPRYYGSDERGYYVSNEHVFLLEFDYAIGDGSSGVFIDSNVVFVITDINGVTHTGTTEIASDYADFYSMPECNFKYIPFTIHFSDEIDFTAVDDIDVHNGSLTENANNNYNYPPPSYSTDLGPGSRIMCGEYDHVGYIGGHVNVVLWGNEYTPTKEVFFNDYDLASSVPIFIDRNMYSSGAPVSVSIRVGGIEEDIYYNLHLYICTYMSGRGTSQLQSQQLASGLVAQTISFPTISSFKPSANINEFRVVSTR